MENSIIKESESYLTISLYGLNGLSNTPNNIQELIDSLTQLKEMGYTTFDTMVELIEKDYYNEVSDIKLEILKQEPN